MPARRAEFLGKRLLGPLVCALWAGLICYFSGRRGFFALDQSIVFNGAWRILCGQIPFRDFYLPYGPVSIWIQAAAFQIGGMTYQTYVLTAVAMNIGGAWLAFGTFRAWIPERTWPAWAAGLMTGSWLYAPMGTAYVEQTGFLALWVGIFCVVRGSQTAGLIRWFWFPLAGLALAAAVLSKTNTGMLAVPILFYMAAVLRGRPVLEILRDGLGLAMGLGLGLMAFYLWLKTCSDPAAFVRSVLEIAGQEGRRRIFENKDFPMILGSFFTGKGNDLIRILTIAAYTLMGLGWILAVGPWKNRGTKKLLQWTSVGLLAVVYQQAFGLTSSNNGINERPLLGLIFVCAILCIQEMVAVFALKPFGERQAAWYKLITALFFSMACLFTAYLYFMRNRGMGNFDFLLGVILAWMIFSYLWKTGDGRSLRAKRVAWGSGLVWGILWVMGSWGAYFRQAQDIFHFQTRYVLREEIPLLRGLAWAEGLDGEAREIHPTWEELVQVWQSLRTAPGRFYLFGDYTILYAATGKPPMGLLPWFHQGLTYSARYDSDLDLRLATMIDQPDVTYFVTEESTFMRSRLQDFPQVERVLKEKYRSEQKIGLFRLYRRIGTEST